MLDGKRALITGGASKVGRACATLFAEHGARIAVADIDAARGRELCRELAFTSSESADATFYEVDLREESEIERMCGAWLADGAPDVWLNCAGVYAPGYVDELPDEALWEMTQVNLLAAFRIAKRIAPAMAARGGGAIVQFASEYALTGYNGVSGYAATMGGVCAMTQSLAIEFAPRRVRMNCLLPGLSASTVGDQQEANMTEDERAAFWRKIAPIPRRARDEELADAALFLASDMSRYITGEAIFVSGGQHVVAHNHYFRVAR